MRVFRRKFFDSSTWKMIRLPLIFLIIILGLHYKLLFLWEWDVRGWLALLLGLLLFSPVIASMLISLFYVEIYDDRLVLSNGMCRLWRISYVFSQYQYCRLEYNRGYLINIVKMRKNNDDKIFPFFGIDLVDPKDLKEIISILESKGVTVITKDLKEINAQ